MISLCIYSQILFLVTNDSTILHGQAQSRHGKLKVDAKRLKQEKGVCIVPVAIGDNAAVDDLKGIAKLDKVISSKVYEIRSKLKQKLICGKLILDSFLTGVSLERQQSEYCSLEPSYLRCRCWLNIPIKRRACIAPEVKMQFKIARTGNNAFRKHFPLTEYFALDFLYAWDIQYINYNTQVRAKDIQ